MVKAGQHLCGSEKVYRMRYTLSFLPRLRHNQEENHVSALNVFTKNKSTTRETCLGSPQPALMKVQGYYTIHSCLTILQ